MGHLPGIVFLRDARNQADVKTDLRSVWTLAMTTSSSIPPLVRLRKICKWFGPVQVLFDVDIDFYPGEIHVLAGENGAGKSTLVRILAGNYPDYSGHIELGGQPVRLTSPRDASALGVAMIYQELSLVTSMSVQDNLFLGQFPCRHFGWINRRQQMLATQRVLENFGLAVEPTRPVGEYPIAVQQMIEIAKAISRQALVIIMDEPTSALSEPECERLFALVDKLKKAGLAVVFITHKLEEMEALGDRITVLRDGRVAGHAIRGHFNAQRIIQWMVGRHLEQHFPPRSTPHPSERLRVESLTVRRGGIGGRPAVRNLSFSVRAGEVLGLAGLQGSGTAWVLRGLFDPTACHTTGRVWLDGKPIHLRFPADAIRHGIGYAPSDRKSAGLIMSMSVAANATITDWHRLTCWGWRKIDREMACAALLADKLRLKAPSLLAEAGHLSGGNQQKVVLAKGIHMQPTVLLLDEPTRGIDVGAKHDIYELIHQWTQEGITIILTTSELPELLALSHRILVLHRGEAVAELTAEEATPEKILEAAMGQRSALPGQVYRGG